MTTAVPVAMSAGAGKIVSEGLSASSWPTARGAPFGQSQRTWGAEAGLSAAYRFCEKGPSSANPNNKIPKRHVIGRVIGFSLATVEQTFDNNPPPCHPSRLPDGPIGRSATGDGLPWPI